MISETSSIYQLFIRNYTPEGTFAAAIPRLAGVAALGCDWVYLTPIHPIGKAARKGGLGSPYAIADYGAIDPALGTIDDFRAFLAAAHGLGLKVMMDVVYNHAAPDSVLARERPEWFLLEGMGPASSRGELEAPPEGARLGRKCADWSDVVDFDYSSSPELWMELISTLQRWRDEGVDGFRCDVASLVPVDFWKQARQRVNQYDPGLRRERHPLAWLAESVHPGFLLRMRDKGFAAWSEPELHAAFDASYDYDGWERLERAWKGERGPEEFLEYLDTQRALYPAKALKLRFLENHDQPRAAGRFPDRALLASWTLLSLFIPGVGFCYMGQEFAIARKPDLFEKDPVDWASGDPEFRDWFSAALKACRKAKAEAPFFRWEKLGEGEFRLERYTSYEALREAKAPRFNATVRLGGSGAGGEWPGIFDGTVSRA